MAGKKHVLITGASGLIGGLTIAALGDKYEFSGLSRRPVQGIPHTQADITDAKAIEPAFNGIHTVLHLAAANQPDDVFNWTATMQGTVVQCLSVTFGHCSRSEIDQDSWDRFDPCKTNR